MYGPTYLQRMTNRVAILVISLIVTVCMLYAIPADTARFGWRFTKQAVKRIYSKMWSVLRTGQI